MDQFNTNFAKHWDQLVNWDLKDKLTDNFLPNLLKKLKIHSVIDVALGTGYDSINLITKGFDVFSVDISPAMIDVAIKNAESKSVTLTTYCVDWVDMNKLELKEKFDAAICLGNSFACENNSEKRKISFSNWCNLIKDDGVLIIDRRNYEALLSNNYPKNTSHYFGNDVAINFNHVSQSGTIFTYEFKDGEKFSLQMFPILESEFLDLARNNNMLLLDKYGDLSKDKITDVSFYTYVFRKKLNEKI